MRTCVAFGVLFYPITATWRWCFGASAPLALVISWRFWLYKPGGPGVQATVCVWLQSEARDQRVPEPWSLKTKCVQIQLVVPGEVPLSESRLVALQNKEQCLPFHWHQRRVFCLHSGLCPTSVQTGRPCRELCVLSAWTGKFKCKWFIMARLYVVWEQPLGRDWLVVSLVLWFCAGFCYLFFLYIYLSLIRHNFKPVLLSLSVITSMVI